MKKLSSFMLVLLLAVSLCACGESAVPQTTEPADTAKPVVYEKNDGLLSEEIHYNADGLRYMTVRYEYDGEGRVIKELTLGVNEAPESYTAYEYDADGRLIRESFFIAVDADSFEPDGECVYQYDSDGLCTAKESTAGGYKSGCEYSYNADKLLSEDRCSEDGELIYIQSYSYDENGNAVKLVRKSVMTGTESVTETVFDESGRPVKEVSADGSYAYSYNEHGDEIRMDCFDTDGTLKYSRLTDYEYDEAGNIVKSTVSSGNDSFAGTVTEYVIIYAKG